MTNYGLIPVQLMFRFPELTKTEIIVLCCLYGARNRKTGLCNPTRSFLARSTGISRSHVSEATQGLIKKGWILEPKPGLFELMDEPQTDPQTSLFPATKKPKKTVPESGTLPVPELGTPPVPESGTFQTPLLPEGVPESGTDLYRNTEQGVPESGTAHIRNLLNRELTEKEHKNKNGTEPESNFKTEHSNDTKNSTPPTKSKTDAQMLMQHHHDRIGKIRDGAAQGKAVKDLLKDYPIDDLIAAYNFQVFEMKPRGWRTKVSWTTVLSEIEEWTKFGKPKHPDQLNGRNGNGHNSSYRTSREQKAVDDHNTIESVRARVEARNQRIPGPDASDRE